MPVVSMIGILILTVLTVALGHERLMQVGLFYFLPVLFIALRVLPWAIMHVNF